MFAALSVAASVGLAQEPVKKPAAPAAQTSGVPKLEVRTNVWDFGEKWAGEKAETTITLTNVGDAPLKIDQVKSSCGCTVAKVEKTLFQPGESEEVKVTYSTKKRTENVSQKIRVHSNDPASPVTVVEIKGRVRQLLEMSEARGLNFGPIGRDDAVTKSIEIECAYTEPLDLKLKEILSEAFDVQLEEIEAGKRYRLTATTRPPLQDGPIRAKAQLLTGVELVPEVTVSIWGTVQAPVAVAPEVLYVSDQTTEPARRVVRVTSRRDKPVTVTGVTASDPAVKVEMLPAGDRSRKSPSDADVTTFRVTLPPAAEIPADGMAITITTDDEEYAKLVVPVAKRGKPEAQSATSPNLKIRPKAATAKSRTAGKP
ncbi:MAG: DUF1573 domain-containing protein [Planctomycetes bacterium]|nr:DUF1573 domain-containing protein [Planctomycetota bacterium]